jgi:hypothetical protein
MCEGVLNDECENREEYNCRYFSFIPSLYLLYTYFIMYSYVKKKSKLYGAWL